MKKFFKILGIIWILAGSAFFIHAYLSFGSRGFDESILNGDHDIAVEISDDFISFVPKSESKGKIFFYPGALVDPFAYSPLCRTLSENGYETIIVRMPWRLASRGYNLINSRNMLSGRNSVTLIGHSQGGKMVARFVFENPGSIENLVLLGTTHPRDLDLSGREVNVLKIYGSDDGIASSTKVLENVQKLPANTEYHEIVGGNHSKFGYYGHQFGDNRTKITRREQHHRTATKILEFMSSRDY